MSRSHKTLFGAAILAICTTGCLDPAKSFEDFDNRVIDASPVIIGGACGGELPDISGEFFLNLAPSIAPTSFLQFIVTTNLNKTVDPAILSLTFQPLCTQESQCTVGQPVGEPFTLEDAEVTEECGYEVRLDMVPIDGGANSISGSPIIGNLDMLGSIRDTDLFCGIVNGDAVVGGAPIPVNGSTFGAVRIAPGTLGDSLPAPVFECPSDETDPDAGVADAGVPDAAAQDAAPLDAALDAAL